MLVLNYIMCLFVFLIAALASPSFTQSNAIPFNETITFQNPQQEISVARCYLSDCTLVEYIQNEGITDQFQDLLIQSLKEKDSYVGFCTGLNCTMNLSQTVPMYLSVGKTVICEEEGCDADAGNTVFGSGNMIASGNTAQGAGTANVGNIIYADNGPVNAVSTGNTAVGNGPVNAGNTVIATGNGPMTISMVSSGNVASSTNGDANAGNIITLGNLRRKILQADEGDKCGAEFEEIPPCCVEETVVEKVQACQFAEDRGMDCDDFKAVNGNVKKLKVDDVVQVCV